MAAMTPWGLLSAGGTQDAAQVSLSRPMGLFGGMFTGDVHAGLGQAGRYAGAGMLYPMFNPMGLGGSLGLGVSADYGIDAGKFIPQATARYATELGGGRLGFAASATPTGLNQMSAMGYKRT